MRHLAVYLPIDQARRGKGQRAFLYVESFTRDQVEEHARTHAPPDWILASVRPARPDTHYLEVPDGSS